MRSRFEWGFIADVQPPDFETRVAILKKKAALERALLADDVAYLIAGRVKSNIRSNIRQLEGALTRMIAVGAMTGGEMTVDLAHEVLSDLWGGEKTIIPIELIERKVSQFFGVTLSELKAKDRAKAVAFPRQIAAPSAARITPRFCTRSARSRPFLAKIPRCGRPSTGSSKGSPCDPDRCIHGPPGNAIPIPGFPGNYHRDSQLGPKPLRSGFG